jgi:hypothetical protein
MGTLAEEFCVAAGTIAGGEHVRLHRNNQDGVALAVADDCIVAAVTDGCSSGASSEVGARLGARWLAEWVPEYRRLEKDDQGLCAVAAEGLTGYLGMLGRGLRPDPGRWLETVNDFLLFTFLVAVIDPERTLVFGLGDGVWSVNGRCTVLDPGPGNAPPYLAYRLAGSALSEGGARRLEPVLHHAGPTWALRSLLIGTDGVADLAGRALEALDDGSLPGGPEQFERDPRYGRNPSLLQKRLVVLGERNRRLRDDTTMVLVRRRESP